MDWSSEAMTVFALLSARVQRCKNVGISRKAVDAAYADASITHMTPYMVAAYFVRHHWDAVTRDECERIAADVWQRRAS